MKHQIKIVIDYEEEGIDCDESLTSGVIVYLDERAIGCIQQINFRANAQAEHPQIEKFELTFPDFHNSRIEENFQSPFVGDVDEYIKMFSKIPALELKLQKLENKSGTHKLEEVGTNGCIDLIPMKINCP